MCSAFYFGPDPRPREERLTERFGALVRRQDSPLALRAITLVGGEGSVGADAAHYTIALRALDHLGIPLDPDFRITVVNYEKGGKDFLVESPPTDLLITCFINNPTPNWAMPGVNSPHHYQPGIWWRKAVEAGARVICTSGASPDEIGAQDFKDGPYVLLGHNFGLDETWIKHGSTLVHEDYLPVLKKHGHPERVSAVLGCR